MEIIFQIILLAIIAVVCYFIVNLIYESPLEKFIKVLELTTELRRSVEVEMKEEQNEGLNLLDKDDEERDVLYRDENGKNIWLNKSDVYLAVTEWLNNKDKPKNRPIGYHTRN